MKGRAKRAPRWQYANRFSAISPHYGVSSVLVGAAGLPGSLVWTSAHLLWILAQNSFNSSADSCPSPSVSMKEAIMKNTEATCVKDQNDQEMNKIIRCSV